jgi:hypothetical protein
VPLADPDASFFEKRYRVRLRPSIIVQMFGIVAWDAGVLIFGCSAPGGYVAYTGYFSFFLGMGN